MKRKLIFTFTLSLASIITFGQAPSILSQDNYGGTNADRAMSVVKTSDGGYIVAGYTLSNNGDVTGAKGGEDVWVVKLNSNLSIDWKKIYGGSHDDRANAIQQTIDGGYIFAGSTNSDDGDVTNLKGSFDMWVVKLNASGNITWQKALGGSDEDYAFSIDQLASGSYVVAGSSKSETDQVGGNNGGNDFWVVKLNTNGNIVWETNLGGGSDEFARGVQELADGNIIVAGYTNSDDQDVSNNKGGNDYWIIRLRANGNIKWKNTYGGTNNDEAYSVTQLSNGNIVVVGESESDNGDVPNIEGGDDVWLLRLKKAAGDIIFSRTYGGETFDHGHYVRETPDEKISIIGTTESDDGDVTGHKGGTDFWTLKLQKSNGNIIWQKTLGGFDDDDGAAIDVTSDGGYILAGESESDDGDLPDNNGNDDYWVVRLDNDGQKLDELAFGSGSGQLLAYPNPVTDHVTVKGIEATDRIELFDTFGRLLQALNADGATISISLTDYAPGIYLMRHIRSDGTINSLKILKQ